MLRLTYILFILFSFTYSFGQVDNQVNGTFSDKVKANREKLKTSPEEGFIEMEELIEEARRLKDKEAELRLLFSKYEYHYLRQIDFNQMFSAAKELQSKAQNYNNIRYQAVSHKFLAEAYVFNGLYDNAIEEIEKGLFVLDKADGKEQNIINEKAKLYTTYANIHTSKKDYRSSIHYLRMSVKEHNKLTSPEQRRGTKFMDYSNLGMAFMQFDLDSATYYATKSVSLSLESEADHNLNFSNYLTLGKVEKKRKNYQKALHFFDKAENIIEGKYFLNIRELYTEFIEIHEILGNKKEQDSYRDKLRDLELTVSKRQNTALHGLLKEKAKITDNKQTKSPVVIVIIATLFLGIAGIYGYIITRGNKKKRLQQLQKQINLTPEDYKNLIEIARTNDTSFLLAFEEHYPEFGSKLHNINAGLTDIEIDLLAMIKLKLTNKEIAQYRFVQPKTVQNRRHRIRKKLNLSNSVDLDRWVEEL